MKTIKLPYLLSNILWLEYCDLYGSFKGFRNYISYKIPNAVVNGTIREGFTLTFEKDEDLTCFLLSNYEILEQK